MPMMLARHPCSGPVVVLAVVGRLAACVRACRRTADGKFPRSTRKSGGGRLESASRHPAEPAPGGFVPRTPIRGTNPPVSAGNFGYLGTYGDRSASRPKMRNACKQG